MNYILNSNESKLRFFSAVMVFIYIFSLSGLDLLIVSRGEVSVAEASGTQTLGDLEVGDKVVDLG